MAMRLLPWLLLLGGTHSEFQNMGIGFCMDFQNIYYDSFTAEVGELGYGGTLSECELRSEAEPQSPGFAFGTSSDCTVYMNNGQTPSSFQVPSTGIVDSNYGNGEVKQASGHTTATICYKKLPPTTSSTTTESTSSTASTASTTTTTTTTTKGVTNDRYTVSADSFCSNAVDSSAPSILQTSDSKESCWDYCSREVSCIACFQPCTDNTQGGCASAEGCLYVAVSLCSTRVSAGCGAQIWRKAQTSSDPLLALRIVLIVVGVLLLLGIIALYCWWKRRRKGGGRVPLTSKAPVTPVKPDPATVGASSAKKVDKSIPVENEEGAVISDAARKIIPVHWGHSVETTAFKSMLYVSEDKHKIFEGLLSKTYKARTTQDRPCPVGTCAKTPGGCPCVQPDGNPGLPASYVIRRVIRVENSSMWSTYMAKRERLRSRGSIDKPDPPVETAEIVAEHPGIFTPLDPSVNEFYLWHGTHIRAALSIAREDFRIEMAGSNAGTMYGKGCYLAENCTKADEYAKDEPHGYYEGVFALLLCRVSMGKYFYTTERNDQAGDKVKSGEFDSTVGDRTKKANTFREFVVYDTEQVYPEYVVLYSRQPRAVALETFRFGLTELHAELPVYWQHCHVNPTINRFEKQFWVRGTSRRLLEDLAKACNCQGKKVLAARRIEVSSTWNRYVRFKLRLKEELSQLGLPAFASAQLLEGKMERGEILTYTYLKNLYGQGVQTTISIDGLEDAIQEHLLWHGTSKVAAEAIVRSDFRIPEDAKHGFRFGSGLYFAEDLSKSLSYAPLESGSEGKSSQFVLLCRVLCGQMHYTDQMSDGTATATAKQVGKHAVLANPSSKGPREFIVLSEMQVYPEYLVELAPKGPMEP